MASKIDSVKETQLIDKIILRLLIAGLTLGLIFIYFAQERLYSSLMFNDLSLGPERFLRILCVILLFIVVLFSVFRAKTKYTFQIYFAYLLLLTTIIVVYLSYGASLFDMTEFMSTKGLGPYICMGLIFVSYNNNTFEKFNTFLLIAVIVLMVLCIYNFIDFGVGAYRGMAIAKYRVYAVNAMWTFPYIFLTLKNHKTLSKYRFIVLFIGIALALAIQTRSFLILYAMVILFDFYHSQKKPVYIILGIILGFFFITFLFSSENLGSSFDQLENRGLDDSRTNQLEEFLSQVNLFELIVGKGPYASWQYSSGVEYHHLDNQWLLLLWWAGLIPFLSYLYLTAYIPIRMFFIANDYETKVESFILILWVLACGGLAIFSTMSVEFYFFIICIIQGRLLYKYSIDK